MILQKIKDGDRYSEILPLWKDKTAVLLAGGASLTRDQVMRVRDADDVKVIAVNDTYLWAPWADVNYFGDSRWWDWQTKGVAKPLIGLTAEQVRVRFSMFQGQKCSVEHSGDHITDPAVHILRNLHYPRLTFGLSKDPRAIVTGKNSGFAALNIAILAGARRIVLLGYDAHPGKDNRHWFGEHPVASGVEVYEAMRQSFSTAEQAIKDAGVEVVNCSPGTELNSFPKVELEAVL